MVRTRIWLQDKAISANPDDCRTLGCIILVSCRVIHYGQMDGSLLLPSTSRGLRTYLQPPAEERDVVEGRRCVVAHPKHKVAGRGKLHPAVALHPAHLTSQRTIGHVTSKASRHNVQ